MKMSRFAEAREELQRAIALTKNLREQKLLEDRLTQLEKASPIRIGAMLETISRVWQFPLDEKTRAARSCHFRWRSTLRPFRFSRSCSRIRFPSGASVQYQLDRSGLRLRPAGARDGKGVRCRTRC